MAYDDQSLGDAQNLAKEKGLVCILPKDNELFIDIDDEDSFDALNASLSIIRHQVDVSIKQTASPSGRKGRHHVVATFSRNVTALERIALQAILGSDRKREAISWARLERGEKDVTRFFEKPEVK